MKADFSTVRRGVPNCVLFFLIIPWLAFAKTAADPENCLTCHRYPTMGIEKDSGEVRLYYVNPELWENSVHGRLECSNCHLGADEIPHNKIERVDCSTECHLMEPSEEREFSHANMIEGFEGSVHGPKAGVEMGKALADDLPTCVYCHGNRVLSPPTELWGKPDALAYETLTRCKGCHTEEDWAEQQFAHMTHRMRRPRLQREVVELCAACHGDRAKMSRHGLETVNTFKETFHWKLVRYGVSDAPDCLSCHVPVGYSAHTIRPSEDPISPLNEKNRVSTCANPSGVQSCHEQATEAFATGRVHAYGEKAVIASAADADDDDGGLLYERASETYSPEAVFQYKILEILRLIYKLLIGTVIGGMTIHQMMDFYRVRKNHH